MVLTPVEDDKNVDDSRGDNLFGLDGTMSFAEVGYQPTARANAGKREKSRLKLTGGPKVLINVLSHLLKIRVTIEAS